MSRVAIAAIAVALLSTAAVPLAAKEKPPVFRETAAVKDKPGALALDPAKAYILLRSTDQTGLYLFKVPTAEDQATYDRLRADAFNEARQKFAKKLAGYEAGLKASRDNPRLSKPEKPVEPTNANFAFTPFALLTGVAIGPTNRFAKAGFSTYLQEVTPGTYRIYGPISVLPNGAMSGACYCMGSVRFDARPGEITDLGIVPAPKPQVRPDGDSSWPGAWDGQAPFADASTAMPLDPRLSAARTVRAAFRPVGKMPNLFGLQVSRLPEMAGVMRYDRDRIVDLTGK